MSFFFILDLVQQQVASIACRLSQRHQQYRSQSLTAGEYIRPIWNKVDDARNEFDHEANANYYKVVESFAFLKFFKTVQTAVIFHIHIPTRGVQKVSFPDFLFKKK